MQVIAKVADYKVLLSEHAWESDGIAGAPIFLVVLWETWEFESKLPFSWLGPKISATNEGLG